jgi:hypothetical protein
MSGFYKEEEVRAQDADMGINIYTCLINLSEVMTEG